MAPIARGRLCASIDGDFVVFLIGVRLNSIGKFWKWWPVVSAMPRMLDELARKPALGLLHSSGHAGLRSATFIQYWRSAEHLQAYASSRTAEHLPAWAAFNRTVGDSGDVGIWHETFLVRAGQYETIYANMPATGLGNVGTLSPAIGARRSAKGRIGSGNTIS